MIKSVRFFETPLIRGEGGLKNIRYLHQLYVQKKDKEGDCCLEMKENCTKEDVMLVEKILFQYICLIIRVKSMIKEYDDQMPEILWIIDVILISQIHLISNLASF